MTIGFDLRLVEFSYFPQSTQRICGFFNGLFFGALWIAPINRFVPIAAGCATFVANFPQCERELPLQISWTQVVMSPSNIVDSIKASTRLAANTAGCGSA
ncbi:MAG TPA: hypothetical protein VN682_06235 [Terriglobales bacterium]|nr:hypothetical protein [Terriglobales bacterium]